MTLVLKGYRILKAYALDSQPPTKSEVNWDYVHKRIASCPDLHPDIKLAAVQVRSDNT